MNTSKFSKYLITAALGVLSMTFATSCNDEWTEEQYFHFISFKAPLNTSGTSVGVTTVYVPFTRVDSETNEPLYGETGLSHYELPVLVSGTTATDYDIVAKVAHSDTLDVLNPQRFGNRTELYYKDMSEFATYPETVNIPKGEDIAILPVKLNLNGIDLSYRYVLPITVVDNPAGNCQRHPRKNFATAMLRILPFNDYSGIYQASNVKFYYVTNGVTDADPGALSTVQTYVVDEDEVFFYAGTFNESSQLRRNFKIFAKFIPTSKTTGSVEFRAENEKMNFVQNKVAHYTIIEQADEVQNYIMRRTLIISDIDYNFDDYLTASGTTITYNVNGNMTMERKLNTQMPIEDQIIFD